MQKLVNTMSATIPHLNSTILPTHLSFFVFLIYMADDFSNADGLISIFELDKPYHKLNYDNMFAIVNE